MAANILSGMVPLCLSVFLFFSVGSRADEAAVYDDLPSFMDIRIERLSGDARHLKDLLDQGKLGDFYQQALPVLNRELFDEDGGMTPEELENALFINNMVVKAPYQDYRLDNFSIWINGSELETKFKACCNLSKIQTYVRENKRLRQGKELARFCLEAEFEYIRRMMLQGAAVYRYIAGLEAEPGNTENSGRRISRHGRERPAENAVVLRPVTGIWCFPGPGYRRRGEFAEGGLFFSHH